MSDGRFKPGFSGNPAGKLPGTKNRKTLVMEEFEKAASDVAKIVAEKARAGEMRAIEMLLLRTDPPARSRSQTVEFELDPDASIEEQAKQVWLAISQGQVDPDTGKMLLECLSTFAGIKDVEAYAAELRRRALRRSKPQAILGSVVHPNGITT